MLTAVRYVKDGGLGPQRTAGRPEARELGAACAQARGVLLAPREGRRMPSCTACRALLRETGAKLHCSCNLQFPSPLAALRRCTRPSPCSCRLALAWQTSRGFWPSRRSRRRSRRPSRGSSGALAALTRLQGGGQATRAGSSKGSGGRASAGHPGSSAGRAPRRGARSSSSNALGAPAAGPRASGSSSHMGPSSSRGSSGGSRPGLSSASSNGSHMMAAGGRRRGSEAQRSSLCTAQFCRRASYVEGAPGLLLRLCAIAPDRARHSGPIFHLLSLQSSVQLVYSHVNN